MTRQRPLMITLHPTGLELLTLVITRLNILQTHMLYVTVHAQLHASRHVTCLHLRQWRLFEKEGILHLPFHIDKVAHYSLYSAANVAHFLSKSG